MPWDDWLELATGVARWTPRTFWRSTPMELGAALVSRMRMMGLSPEGIRAQREYQDDHGRPLPGGLSRTDLHDLLELQENAESEGAPDGV